jgi:hypothetical protein
MTRPTRLEVCCGGCEPKCGKCGIPVEVELTDAEIAQMEADRIAAEQERAAREAEAEALASVKASAKAKLIAGQPLTAEEADTLVI